MKNQYFGDINDYRKYGLLRVLGGVSGLSIGVCGLLTEDDGGNEKARFGGLADDELAELELATDEALGRVEPKDADTESQT